MEENEYGDRLEGSLITRTFYVGGMPVAIWEMADSFCKEFYGDVRWRMIKDLIEKSMSDFKYELLHEELMQLKQRIAMLEEEKNKAEQKAASKTDKRKVFGDK